MAVGNAGLRAGIARLGRAKCGTLAGPAMPRRPRLENPFSQYRLPGRPGSAGAALGARE